MPKAHHSSYNLAFNLKVVAETEAIDGKEVVKMWGILNALDSTEDDEVYPDDMPELADDDMVRHRGRVWNWQRTRRWMKTSCVSSTKQNSSFRSHHLNKSLSPTPMINFSYTIYWQFVLLIIISQLIAEYEYSIEALAALAKIDLLIDK